MAQSTKIIYIDDLDQEEIDTTGGFTPAVQFALDDVTYEIHLNADHQRELRESFGPYIGSGRRISTTPMARRRPDRRARRTTRDTEAHKIRTWAQGQGMQVSERGRISAEVVQAYEKAQKQDQKMADA